MPTAVCTQKVALAKTREAVKIFKDVYGETNPRLVAAHVVDRDDAGVVEPRHQTRLAHEPLLELCAREVAPHHLHRHGAIELGVARGVDATHAALTEQALDLESLRQLDRLRGWR